MSSRSVTALLQVFETATVDLDAPSSKVRFEPAAWVELEMRTLTPAKRRHLADYVWTLVLATAKGAGEPADGALGLRQRRNLAVASAIMRRLEECRDPRWVCGPDGEWVLDGEKRRFPRGISRVGGSR